jgi:hypothetical protein
VLWLISDGANWQVLDHKTTTAWTAYTPTLVGFGTPSAVDCFWRRNGDSMEVMGAWKAGTLAASVPTMSLPTGASIDSSKILSVTMRSHIGTLYGQVTTTAVTTPAASRGPWWVSVLTGDLTTVTMGADVDLDDAAANSIFRSQNATTVFVVNSTGFAIRFTAPISGWQP